LSLKVFRLVAGISHFMPSWIIIIFYRMWEIPVRENYMPMSDKDIPYEYYGSWWIIEASHWGNDSIDIIGPAMISLMGYAVNGRFDLWLKS
jgi:hypothetical protein